MRSRLALVLLCLFAEQAFAQDLNLEENKYLGYIYQQQGYQLNDPKGDMLLLWSAHQIPKFIVAHLKGKQAEVQKERQEKIAQLLLNYPEYTPESEDKNIIIENYDNCDEEDEPVELEGHKAPFKSKNLALMMKQVITEEYYKNGIEPQEGKIHVWSDDVKKKLRKKFVFFSRMSKLLVALSRGSTSYYMVTGTEGQLKDYILSRPMDSVSLEEMFRASYRINKGDVYLSLLTIENVLSRFWLTPQREKRAITTRLKNITNFNYKTDKFGAWYHLFGIMLYGYAEGGLKAKIVGSIETLGSRIMARFADERQETYINSRGGVVGGSLRRFMKKKEYESFEANSDYIKEEFYLDLDEDFSKRIKRAKRKEVKAAKKVAERLNNISLPNKPVEGVMNEIQGQHQLGTQTN